MNDVEKRALRAVTKSVADALDRYADAMGAPLREPSPWPLESAVDEVSHAFDSLLAIEPEPAVRETYAWDQGRFASLTVPEIRILANDYRAMAESPPDGPAGEDLKRIVGVVGIITMRAEDWTILRDLVKDAGLDVTKMSDRAILQEGMRIRSERQSAGVAEARITRSTPMTDSPSRVTIVGGPWGGAKGTDSGRR